MTSSPAGISLWGCWTSWPTGGRPLLRWVLPATEHGDTENRNQCCHRISQNAEMDPSASEPALSRGQEGSALAPGGRDRLVAWSRMAESRVADWIPDVELSL